MFDFLYFTWDVDPVLLQIPIGKLTLAIRYYSLLFVAGFPLGYWMVAKMFRREGKNTDLLEPLLYALLLGTILGARLGHCIFYDPHYYFVEHPEEIIKVWHGGLASHGGAVGVLLAILWYARHYGKKNGFDAMWLLDRLMIPICFAGCLIRLGNFFNSEIFGPATDLPWGVKFIQSVQWQQQYAPSPCHPTQLYEAISYLLLGFLLLWVYWKKSDKVYKGWIFGVFLILLFGVRFMIEFVKNDSVFNGQSTLLMGQILSIPFIIAGIIILINSYRKKQPLLMITEPEQPKEKGPRMSHAKRMAAGMKQ